MTKKNVNNVPEPNLIDNYYDSSNYKEQYLKKYSLDL